MQINMSKSYSSSELIAILVEDGWTLYGIEGSHHRFKHDKKRGKVTLKHPQKDVPKGTMRAVLKQAGLR